MKSLALLTLGLTTLVSPALDESDLARPHWKFDGRDSSEGFAAAAAGADDVDADGFADVIIGAPEALEGRGMARVFSGREGSQLLELQGASDGDRFGASVAAAGDVDNDGFGDVVVGAPGNDERPGAAYVYSGKTGALLLTFTGGQPGERFGHAVSGLGDVNGDGSSDIVVGAPSAARKKDPDVGRFAVYSGKDGEELWSVTGKRPGARLGWSVANAGDANNDSFADVLVGAPHGGKKKTTNEGAAYLYNGKKGKLMETFVGAADDDRFGWTVRGAGDATGDGASDLLIGSHGSKGYARLYDGKKGKLLQDFVGVDEGGFFGATLGGALPGRPAFDFDADGLADVIIGAPGSSDAVDAPERPVPTVRIYSGKTGDLLTKVEGLTPADHFGGALAGAGDVNNDGFDDVLVGDDGFGGRKGWARVYLGGSP